MSDKEPDDYALVLPARAELNPMKLCPRCSEVRPLDDFGIYLTPLQAQARGFSGKRRIRDTSAKHCKYCRASIREGNKRLKVNAKGEVFKKSVVRRNNPKKIQTLVAKGLMNEVLAKETVAAIYTRASKAKTDAATRRWARIRKEVWEPHKKEARAEANYALRAMRYAVDKDLLDVEAFFGQYGYLCDLVLQYIQLRTDDKTGTRAPATFELLWAQMRHDSNDAKPDVNLDAKDLRDEISQLVPRVKDAYRLVQGMPRSSRALRYLSPVPELPKHLPLRSVSFRGSESQEVCVTKTVDTRPVGRGNHKFLKLQKEEEESKK